MTRRLACALLAAALAPSACGRPAGADEHSAAPDADADAEAKRQLSALRLREADEAQARAEALCDEGDRLLASGALPDARRSFIAAGRLFEAASRDRNDALDAASAVRAAWSSERSPK